jgi:short-subunit dehydrogenase involved in D-alanine esterification of teichoic acids
LAQAALPHLLAADAGRLVFVSSTAGLHGVRGRSAYAASKGALNAFALFLADEAKRTRLRVNILCPYAATAMTAEKGVSPDPRLAPDRVAQGAAWLASADCTLNGEIIVGGGGHYRRARALESVGGAAPDNPAAAWPTIADMANAREYPGAQAAFADHYAQLKEPQPCV